MKRFLLLFCSAVLVCSIMIVSAFAAETLRFDTSVFDDGEFSLSAPLQGDYTVNFYYGNNTLAFSLGTFDFTYPVNIESTHYYEDVKIDFGFWYTEDELYISCSAMSEDDEFFGALPTVFPEIQYFELVPAVAAPDQEPVSPIDGIFGVFGGVGSWLAGQLGATTSLFWNGQGLTFLGVLSVCALALAVILLLVMVVVRFLRFRG